MVPTSCRRDRCGLRRCAPALVFAVAAAVAAAAQSPLPPVAPQIGVTLTARARQPGEVLRIDIEARAELREVEIHVFDTRIAAVALGPGAWRALVGIDLNVVPGEYTIDVIATTATGVSVTEHQPIVVEDKEFPTRTLRVDPRFVTPPARVRSRIESEAMRLGAIFSSEGSEPAWPGPMSLPIASAVASGFGVRSIFNGEPRAPHGGADFSCPAGTPITAPAPGRIVLVDDLYFTGRTVVIDHGSGLYSLFAHLSRATVREGARLERGDLVGKVGATGRVTGPHLHWSVRLHGARVDPVSLVHATRDTAVDSGD